MEKIKLFLRTLRPWQIVILFSASLLLLSAGIYASRFLRQSAKIKLGSDTGLVLTADRQDSLGTFSDSAFTLKSDTDLTASGIKDKITFFPEVDFDISEITPRQFSLKPKQPLSDNSLYRIKVLSEQKTFSWAFQTKNDFRVVQTLPRDKATYVPLNTGIEITFSHDTYEDIDKYFEITPFVEGRFERHKRTVSFIPKSLSPGTLYTIKISKGLVLNGTKDSLKEDFKYQFETQPTASGGSQTQMYFPKNFYEFSPSETPAFDVYTSSTGGADVSVAVYQYPSVQGFHSAFITKLSIPTWASNSQRSHRVSTSGLSKVLEFNSPIQQQTYTNYFLFPQALPKGFYVVEANIGGGGGITTQALVQITDLSAYLSESSTKTLVWVNDIRTGQPVSGASVSFSSGKGGKTDQDGVAYFDSPPATPDNGEMVSISQGDNSLFIPAQGRLYYSQEYQNSRRLTDKYWSYFYSDRPVYLPTDTVRFWGLLRDRDNLNQKQQFTLEVTRSDYNSWDFNPIVLFTKDFETSDLGTFIGDIPLTSFNPGWYGITVKVGSAIVMSSSFSVETYTKPAYKLTLTPSKNAAIAGETINFSGLATFFEGSPVPSMDLTYSGAQSGTLTTDSLGRYSFNYVANASATSYSPDFKYQYIRSSLPEEGLIQADTSVAVFNSSVVFATPKSETEDNTGKVEIDLRQVDTDVYSYSAIQDIFSPAVNRQLSATLFENQWNKKEVGTYYDFINKVTSPRYEYEQIKNKIADITLATDGQGKAVYEFPVAEDKSYNLIVNATDDQGRTTSQDIYISGYSRNYYLNNNVYLKTDKSGPNTNNFAIGEQVNLQIMRGESPLEAASTDKFLYQFAQRGLKSYQILDQSNISFKFADAFVPNVVVAAVRFTGKTYQVSENTNLYFDTASKKLTLDVTQDKSSYLPGDQF
ncbi:MAG: hypothetical protein UW80_C0029G0020 [Microgenomates group bacterium GW2011_GWC1_44_9]|nr:MAG: hypothetical protein UW80_C0029G0020 [Microgenomates group bacterium GW2011_GWC1_44_9]